MSLKEGSGERADRRSPMAIRVLAVGALFVLAGYALAFGGEATARASALALTLGNALLAPAAMALGAPLRGRWRRVILIALWGASLAFLAAVGTALCLPLPGPEAPLILGFPRGVAIVLYGAGVLPLLVLPVLFAISFDADAFAPERIRAVRDLRGRSAPGDTSSESPGNG